MEHCLISYLFASFNTMGDRSIKYIIIIKIDIKYK